MKAVHAVYENGRITLQEPAPEAANGPLEVLVIFPVTEDDPWERLLNDPAPRPTLSTLADQVLEEFRQGKTEPLDLDKL